MQSTDEFFDTDSGAAASAMHVPDAETIASYEWNDVRLSSLAVALRDGQALA